MPRECQRCGHYDYDWGMCACPSADMWYSCPIESVKPENQEELKKMAEWYERNQIKND